MNTKFCATLLLIAISAALASAAQAQLSGFSAFAQPNGSAAISGGALTLTSNLGSQQGSAFASAAQTISSGFNASFVYTVGGNAAADGFTFTLQNDPRGTAALGSGGGYLGYGGGANALTNSVAVEFNFNQTNSTGFDTNGSIGTPTNIGNGVALASGQPVSVNLSDNGSVLLETLSQGSSTFSVSYPTGSLQTVLGGPAAFVGFTGSDGGGTSTQTLSSFLFQNSPAAVPEASSIVPFALLLVFGGIAVAARRQKPAV